MIYDDPAHGIRYWLDDDGLAEMTCRTCETTFRADPSDTESESAPYDTSGDPACESCAESSTLLDSELEDYS